MNLKERHKQKMALKRALPSQAIQALVNRLLALCNASPEPPDNSERAVFLTINGKPRPEAVEIGHALYRIRGTDAMRTALNAVPSYDHSELAWDKIGTPPDVWRY